MPTGFDNIATAYDNGFVNTVIGKMQRDIVWKYLDKYLSKYESLNILELNCGTGEDAIWMAEKGHNILATDLSGDMIEVAKTKAKAKGMLDNLSFTTIDIANPDSYPHDLKFDFIFSNFGGYNCISPADFKNTIPGIAGLLKPKGRFIAVIMPKFCLWEWLYFTYKRKPYEAGRRSGKLPVSVSIGSSKVDTWYYSPSEIEQSAEAYLKTDKILPLGFFIPPSYLENFFKKHKRILWILNLKERIFGSFSFLAKFSDHFIIDMEVRK